MLPAVQTFIKTQLEPLLDKPANYEKARGCGFWDDYCLAKFLEGVCLRYLAFPDPNAPGRDEGLEKKKEAEKEVEEAGKGAEEAFRKVFEFGPKIELDHHLVYFARTCQILFPFLLWFD